jgi:trehalose 6-phosphate phosphatase
VKHLLSPRNLPVLERFAWSRVLLAFDFDGTLAPIVVDPEAAQMRARTRELLVRAAGLYPTVVLSGRTRADTRKRVSGVPLQEVIGNHGAEIGVGGPSDRLGGRASDRLGTDAPSLPSPAARRRGVAHRWRRELEQALAEHAGVVIEDKGFSLSIHYRQSRQKKRARAAIVAAVAAIERREALRVMGGKQVVNLLPEGAPHKGIALEGARARLGCDTALYVGDDQTDEDVFALDQPGRLLSVRVGQRESSHADYYLRGQREIDALLRSLIQARTERLARGAA